ncbi:MAG: hypothetical protein E7005_02610 [Alphaproteobacteria bacterium]|nr:hypothetical protein [Alphaproteobacteria bacterium]
MKFWLRGLVGLILIMSGFSVNEAKAETLNWCGEYVEANNKGYIRLLSADIGVGSDDCSKSQYYKQRAEGRTIKIALEFTRNRSTYVKWRKFIGHVIEVKGKYRNGTIRGTKFVRDLGR